MTRESVYSGWGWLIGLWLAIPAWSQVKDFNFRQISLGEGLSQSSVFAIVQDDDGFMWFGTQDGLNQYDGYRFKVYKKRPFDSTSLSHSHVRALLKDQSGNLWIGTAFGLNLLDKRTNRFLNLSHLLPGSIDAENYMVNCLYQDSRGTIWVGTAGGLVRLQAPAGRVKDYHRYQGVRITYQEHNLKSLSNNIVHSIFEDKQGRLWIGTRQGMNRLASVHAAVTAAGFAFDNHRNHAGAVFHLEGKFVSSTVQDSHGYLWVGTGQGLHRVDPDSYQVLASYQAASAKQAVSKQPFSLSSSQVYALLFDKKGILWVGTLGGGINQVTLNAQGHVTQIVPLRYNSATSHIANTHFVLCMYESREANDGTLWLGLEAGGIAQFNPSKNNFKLYRRDDLSHNTLSENNIFAITTDHQDFLWVGTSHGLNKYNPRTDQFTQYFHHPEDTASLADDHIYALYEDREHYLWIGTARGLDRYNRQLNRFEHIEIQLDGKVFSMLGTITSLCEDRQNQLWIGTSYDLIRYNKKTRQAKSYGYHARNAPRLTGGRITTIFQDQQDQIWIGTYAGLNRYDEAKDDFVHYATDPNNRNSLSSNTVFSMLQDPTGAYWIATDMGLNKLVFKNKQPHFSHYMEKDGLPNNFIYGVRADATGRIWMSTNLGLSVFDPRQNTFVNYDEADGLQSKEFNSGAHFLSPRGELFFGGIHGLNSFFPNQMQVNQHVPKVNIVSLFKFEQPVDLDSLRARTDVITLDYRENFFSLEFVSLDYANPQKNRYAYQLEGFDKDWIYCGHRRYVSFTNLDPGEYVFKVKGSNDSGLWNDRSYASMRIVVKPPFWRTWWFYVLSLAILLVTVKIINDIRVRRKLKHLLEIEKIRTIESERIRRQTASDFHDEMGNRITRIGVLTELIKVQINRNGAVPLSEEITHLLSKISENCNTLYNGTRDFIWSINPDNNSFYEVAVRLKDFGDELFDNTPIHFQVGEISKHLHDIKLPMDWSRQLILIFKEALNNTLKYAQCQNVHLHFQVQEEEVYISLTDDGQGFEAGQNKGGTGLHNMTNRAKKISSHLSINSKKNEGTKIIFSGKLPQYRGVLT